MAMEKEVKQLQIKRCLFIPIAKAHGFNKPIPVLGRLPDSNNCLEAFADMA